MRSRSGLPAPRVHHVGGGDEQHLRQIERHAQVIVAEGPVLLGVEHLEQRRGGIALDARAELVDLVEHHDAVPRARLAQRLDDVAGQRADIGAPVAADLGLVMDAAQARAHEFAPGRLGDRLAERRLADAGRADEAQDRAAAARLQLLHREIFEDAARHLLQPEMVLVERLARLGEVDDALGPHGPRPSSTSQSR